MNNPYVCREIRGGKVYMTSNTTTTINLALLSSYIRVLNNGLGMRRNSKAYSCIKM